MRLGGQLLSKLLGKWVVSNTSVYLTAEPRREPQSRAVSRRANKKGEP